MLCFERHQIIQNFLLSLGEGHGFPPKNFSTTTLGEGKAKCQVAFVFDFHSRYASPLAKPAINFFMNSFPQASPGVIAIGASAIISGVLGTFTSILLLFSLSASNGT